jgi:hypothetical protein
VTPNNGIRHHPYYRIIHKQLLMNTRTAVASSIIAVATVIVLFASGPATQAQAFGGLHHGFPFHHFPFHHFPFHHFGRF